MVDELPQQLHRRLGAVLLQAGHVEVVNENCAALARSWAKKSSSPLLELGQKDLAGLPGGRLRAKGDLN